MIEAWKRYQILKYHIGQLSSQLVDILKKKKAWRKKLIEVGIAIKADGIKTPSNGATIIPNLEKAPKCAERGSM